MFASVLLAVLSSPQDVRLPALFSDHMVVQRNSKFKVWGWARPGSKVTVTAGWARMPVSVVTNGEGTFEASVPTSKAGGPYEIKIDGATSMKLRDVMVGDVWVCSGQSNMEWPMTATDHAKEDIAGASNKNVRLFMVANSMLAKPQDDCGGTWNVSSPDAVKDFSAVAYFFAKEVSAKTGVTIGVIDSTWGGTEAELWTSEPGLVALPDFGAKIKNKQEILAKAASDHAVWEKQVEAKDPGYAWVKNDQGGWGITTPGPWSLVETLKDFDGSAWFRSSFDLPASWKSKKVTLCLGTIDDDDVTWVNGVQVGATRGYNLDRNYVLPSGTLHEGTNQVMIRVWDFVAEGGFASAPYVTDGTEKIALNQWVFRKGAQKSELPPEPSANVPNNSLLFNGMIHPLLNYPIKGALWYQGEANVGRAFQYRTLFPAMIQDWRKNWKSEFPFYFVQIAPFNGYGSAAAAELREAQNEALKLKRTGVVVVTDVTGNLDDIHPQDKRTVGHRLALWALAKDYGVPGVTYSGPLYKSMKVEGNKIRLFFNYASGLYGTYPELADFQIAGSDKVFRKASARIEGETVVVTSGEVQAPVAVRMGWSTSPQPSLFNGAKLPASPFRTDNWPGLTDGAKW